MKIRQETPKDYEEVYELIREAFASAEHADGNEQDLVEALRKGDAFIPELSLVAEEDGQLAGHILFTKAQVGEAEVLALAPLSVRPAFQRSRRATGSPERWDMPTPLCWGVTAIIQGQVTERLYILAWKCRMGSLLPILWQYACGKTRGLLADR